MSEPPLASGSLHSPQDAVSGRMTNAPLRQTRSSVEIRNPNLEARQLRRRRTPVAPCRPGNKSKGPKSELQNGSRRRHASVSVIGVFGIRASEFASPILQYWPPPVQALQRVERRGARKRTGTCLLTSHNRHWHAHAQTLSARPNAGRTLSAAVHEELPVSLKTAAEATQLSCIRVFYSPISASESRANIFLGLHRSSTFPILDIIIRRP